ncbi:MAG: response regulator transcription factor [Thermomicrobiales bacterium]
MSSPARVLLVVDQPQLREDIRLALAQGPYTTRAAPAEDIIVTVREWRPHLAIVDFDVSNEIVPDELSSAAPGAAPIAVFALTRRSDLHTRLAAFDRGVDDILTVPFFPQELAARIRAVMRRTHRADLPMTPVLRLGGLEIDILNRSVRVGGHELHLTALDQSLLYLLAANAGRILTRDEILDHLWGVDFAAESNVVDRHVRNLRAKLQDDWHRPRYIATVTGRGYRFVPTPAESAMPALTYGRMPR